jgi:hypothetical protein
MTCQNTNRELLSDYEQAAQFSKWDNEITKIDSSKILLFDLKKSQIENESKYQFDNLTICKADLEMCRAETEASNMLAYAQAKKSKQRQRLQPLW